MRCPHCGQEHADDAQFCPTTGKVLDMPIFCPQCGQPVEPDWGHCAYCGQTLKEENRASAPPAGPPASNRVAPPRSPERPKARRFSPKLLWLILIGAVLGLIIAAVMMIRALQTAEPVTSTPTITPAPPPGAATRMPNVPTGNPNYTHFSRWGLSFDYPADLQEETPAQLSALKNSLQGQLAPFGRIVQQFSLFHSTDEGLTMSVTVYTTPTALTPADIIAEREQVYTEAQKTGDITLVNYVIETRIADLPAVEEDIETGDGSRGWTIKLIDGNTIREISFITRDSSQFPRYTDFLTRLVAELKVEGN